MNSTVSRHVEIESQRCLDAYRANPKLINEHAGIEEGIIYGGYGQRQLYELVQNGADAMLATSGRIELLVTENALYCANEGAPIETEGVDVILSSSVSNKRGAEIGRFGMGFKSVLGLSRNPSFFCKSGSFGFSEELAERHIRPLCQGNNRLPILRIAQPLDARSAAADDPTLESLLRWATTVVKLPLSGDHSWLKNSLRDFPAEFLLFAPHVASLRLQDQRDGGADRLITVKRAPGILTLNEQGRAINWKVFKTVVIPDERARADAGDRASRGEIPISWAVPLERAAPRGAFWAFFPTQQQTTLSGIVNAPWKTNEDRLHLLPGAFNFQLIRAAAALVVESLPELTTSDDPGVILDMLPGQEPIDWADRDLSDVVYELAKISPSVPDQDGKLRTPDRLKLSPRELPQAALELWSSCETRGRRWNHLSTERAQRRRRIERLAPSTAQVAPVQIWLEALIQKGNVRSSVAALRCAELLLDNDFEMEGIRTAKIVLTEDNVFVSPDPHHLFLPGEYDLTTAEASVVHSGVASDKAALRALFSFDVRVVNPSGELAALINTGFETYKDQHWNRFWQLAERAGNDALRHLTEPATQGKLMVRTANGTFRPIGQTLLPGPIVPRLANEEDEVTIDVQYHAKHLDLLGSLGAVNDAVPEYVLTPGPLLSAYRQFAIDQFVAKSKTRPQDSKRLVFDRYKSIGPLPVLDQLSVEGKAEFTHAALELPDPLWKMYHSTVKAYDPVEISPSPALWLLRRRGYVRTSEGIKPIGQALSAHLSEMRLFLPVAELDLDISDRLALRTTMKHADWEQAVETSLSVDDESALAKLYAKASLVVPAPKAIRCVLGDTYQNRPPGTVSIAVSMIDVHALRVAETPYLPANTAEAQILAARWGLMIARSEVAVEISPVDPGPEVPLADRFPLLAERLPANIFLISCTSVLVNEISEGGKQVESRRFVLAGNLAYFDESLSDTELFRDLVQSTGAAISESEIASFASKFSGDSESGTAAILKSDKISPERLARILTSESIPHKLVECLSVDALRRKLPVNLMEAVQADRNGKELSEAEVGEVALALYGTDVLRVYREELATAGFAPPTNWAGSPRAREFARSLGFSDKFAGTPSPRREPLVEVRGPQPLPPLHSFQEEITNRMQEVFVGVGGYRAFISLPTGAGKTRVAVQGLIKGISAGLITRPVLWVAQQDELCEQAVQTWRDAWSAIGMPSMLNISRLWGPNYVSQLDGIQIVVATMAKLDGACKDERYDWLKDVGVLMIDEAHTSITKSYTALLEWSGFGRDRNKDKAPLIGLSATPERGNEEESRRLVERYDARKLDTGVFGSVNPHEALQELGVLARVQHETLGGATIEPTAADLTHFRQYKRLTPDFEERIGRDHERNINILTSMVSKPKDWTMLLFASSVQHAELLACLLTLAGVPSACITGQTPDGARADAIEEFRSGRIRVLTNFNVLTQGFDAPAVRALYVARPTFSANLYQQMVGRGLRGKLNGGKEECLIVNIEDNMAQYGTSLAFHSFAHLWDSQADDQLAVTSPDSLG
ncbi:DEAD/DEAH box helicase [Tunturiibacter lichenicola]|uniref:DEAD/DEAH box helicase n=1 Tax=Tunturiibacter lichenicola TaxID=2051959 RepID=UPI003D9BF1F5